MLKRVTRVKLGVPYLTNFEIIGKLISIDNSKAVFSVEIEVEIPASEVEDVKRFLVIGQKLALANIDGKWHARRIK